ncbi:hypothetical protein A33M_2578 [Rhodovulum sp. PH10]|uniref:DUF3551 domain-containing protein n=1 Tax=Rhodovulum sp. PH10 TaxID=1187851 RepID=UPI00027C2007|nr:DUF3551 domain-containing protein [Rhodovulum sp. PH10]EJW11930.1 hypothetical protein A33M_2578 [Rhodovulum sp. PH10]
MRALPSNAAPLKAVMAGAALAVAIGLGSGTAKADPWGIWSPPSWATWYPWCADLNNGLSEQTQCVYTNLAQCTATVRGVGGSCSPNPYPPPAPVKTSRKKPRAYYR